MTDAPSGRIVAVASGKGGVGKTWLAITLAHSLARAGRRVLLVDGDLGLANVDVQLGLTPQADLSAVVSGRRALADAVTPHQAGFDVITGRSGSLATAEIGADALDDLLRGLRLAAHAYDLVLLDLPAGVERAGRRMAILADLLLVVATDDPTSLTDAYAVLKLYAHDRERATRTGAPAGAPVRVVVNQAANAASGKRTYAALARACTAFLGAAPTLAGVIRRDELVRAAIRRQIPLLLQSPGCNAARDVAVIAQSL